MSNTPSDADIEALAQQHLKAFVQFNLGEVWFEGEVEFARAVLAKWGAPQTADCTRSHPHEDMSGYCLLRTEIARLANENARLKASQPVVREPLTAYEIHESIKAFKESENLMGVNHIHVARAIEAEVRKQDDELIQQLEEALTDIVEAGEEAWGKDRPCVRIGKEAITAARARLGEKT